MSALTIRLPEQVLNEIDQRAQKLHISRSEYIRKSIENMNKRLQKEESRAKLIATSKRVRKESMIINSEFSKVEHDPEI
jgi:metal-responsive CopG/Arc/MetJ family transcriptional regulator